MNKDEALRCLSISKQKFESGQSESALKFANKAQSLYETDEGKNWVCNIYDDMYFFVSYS